MSLSAPTRETPPPKTYTLEIPLVNLPPDVDPASNGAGSTLKPPSKLRKLSDSSLQDPESFRRLSLSTISGLSDDERGRSESQNPHSRYASRSPAPPTTWKASFQHFWRRNRALWFVAAAQLFAALMNVFARLLERDEHPMSPFQLLFVRMGVTSFFCVCYMWYSHVPHFPFGLKEVRVLLLLRGFSGFFGIFGVYYSLQYLPLSDTTVITFLAPSVAGFACYLFLGEPFTRAEKITSIISLLGVVVIARPTSFFNFSPTDVSIPLNVTSNSTIQHSSIYHSPIPTSAQRLSAIGTSLLGVLGAAGAFTTVRWIGKRAHPMLSVNYLAAFCTLTSFSALSISSLSPPSSILHSPKVIFTLPDSLKQWVLMALLSLAGFVMQIMLTTGMSQEKSNRATNMVYTNMLFALLFDRWIFGVVPSGWSLIGIVLILGSAVYVALQKGVEVKEGGRSAGGNRDEERAMLGDMDGVTIRLDDLSIDEELENEDEVARHVDRVRRH